MKKNENKPNSLRKRAEKKLKPEVVQVGNLMEAEVRKLANELQVHQIELKMQNDELRKAQVTIEALVGKYVDIYDFAPVGYFSFSNEGKILEANLTACEMLGTERRLVVGKLMGLFIDSGYKDTFYLHLRHIFNYR
ncbi:MAG: hypothetical protein HQ521_02295, partial [Bacteroidetes bacterium]|nr:hypothetical protein [Bacteroidota bacterium]